MIVALELTDAQLEEIAAKVANQLLAADRIERPTAAVTRRTPYTVPEAAELLGVSRDTVYRMVAAKRLGRVPGSAVVRIPAGEMERVLSGKSES